MHDIDRALFEMEQMEGPGPYEFAGGLQETLETELAGHLLEISSEEELDRFLGNLLGRAASAVRNVANSDAGRAVGGLLKSAAKQVLPRIGQAVGGYIAPGVGGQIGSRLGSLVGSQLGLELEGLSQEDREYEVSRAFVRFANDAAQQAITTPPTVPPAQAAVRAATVAAQRQLPALLPVIQRLTPPGMPSAVGRQSGRWVRHGTTIVLSNV
jgi:hypothetical protein